MFLLCFPVPHVQERPCDSNSRVEVPFNCLNPVCHPVTVLRTSLFFFLSLPNPTWGELAEDGGL